MVVVPNLILFKNPVVVRTHQDIRRVTVICGFAYDVNVGEARKIITKAVEGYDTVEQSSKPIQEFADSSINFEVTWWTGSKPVEVRTSKDQVIEGVKAAFDEAGIEISFPYRTLTVSVRPHCTDAP